MDIFYPNHEIAFRNVVDWAIAQQNDALLEEVYCIYDKPALVQALDHLIHQADELRWLMDQFRTVETHEEVFLDIANALPNQPVPVEKIPCEFFAVGLLIRLGPKEYEFTASGVKWCYYFQRVGR